MATWRQIYGVDDPVDGDVGQFEDVAEVLGVLTERSKDVADSLARFNGSSSLTLFAGQAADAFRLQLREIDARFQDLPHVAAQAHRCMRQHADELRRIRKRADEALARAEVKWRESRQVEGDLAGDRSRADQLRSQLEYLECSFEPDDPTSLTRIEVKRSEVAEAERVASGTVHRRDRIQGELEDIKRSRTEFTADEVELNRLTVRRLDAIDLGAMGDPSLLEQGLGLVLDAFEALVMPYIEFAELLVKDPLWALKEVLDTLSTILTVVALVLALTGVGLPIAALIAGLALTVALAGFLVTAILYDSQRPHPFTGETVTGWDVFFSGVSVVTAMLGLGTATKTLPKVLKLFEFYDYGAELVGAGFEAYEVVLTGRPALSTSLLGPSGLALNLSLTALHGLANRPQPTWERGVMLGECRVFPAVPELVR